MTSGPGRWNWLFVPGGPGLGSETLLGLVHVAAVEGSAWLVDLPGDGSNVAADGTDPYSRWPGVLLEAAQALDNVVMVGHSTGGMFALSVPELQSHLRGLALVGSAPHAGWRAALAAHAARNPLPGVDEAAARYRQERDDTTLKQLALAAAAWNFTPAGLAAGKLLLQRAAYNHRAVAWAETHFDDVYRARWSPQTIPTLIVSGAEDNVVTQCLWRDAPGFTGPNVERRVIAGAGHFPWIENPVQVQTAFAALSERIAFAAKR